MIMTCHTKIGPPKIGPAGPILAENIAKIGPPGPLVLPKLVWLDQFWQSKLVPFFICPPVNCKFTTI